MKNLPIAADKIIFYISIGCFTYLCILLYLPQIFATTITRALFEFATIPVIVLVPICLIFSLILFLKRKIAYNIISMILNVISVYFVYVTIFK